MSLSTLKKQADNFVMAAETIDKQDKDSLSFVQQFPLSKLKEITLVQLMLTTYIVSNCLFEGVLLHKLYFNI